MYRGERGRKGVLTEGKTVDASVSMLNRQNLPGLTWIKDTRALRNSSPLAQKALAPLCRKTVREEDLCFFQKRAFFISRDGEE